MKLVLTPKHLHLIADHNSGESILPLLATAAAGAGLSITLDDSDLQDLEERNPDGLGELLRDISFTAEGMGCYENFDLVPGFEKIENISPLVLFEIMGEFALEPKEASRAEGYHNPDLGISVYWHWDGDGTLLFDCEAFTLVNHDCKCSYGWSPVDLKAEIRRRHDYGQLIADGIIEAKSV